MRIDKPVVEEAIDTDEDLVIAVDLVTFRKSVRCRNIVSEGYRRNIDALNINAWNICAWNICAWSIHARDIDAGNIRAGNIDAWNIDAWNIDARDINACFVVCESRKKKSPANKTVCYSLILKRSAFQTKEQMPKIEGKAKK